MKTEKCPTCGQEMYVRTDNTPTEHRAWYIYVKLKKIKTIHHILPLCHFKSKPAKQFTFELCRACHDELETEIHKLGPDKLHEMRYIKVLIKFILNKNSDVVHLDGVIVGILQEARAYFNRTSNQIKTYKSDNC